MACLYLERPRTAVGLYERLGEIDGQLPLAGLSQVVPFVRAYGALTDRVAQVLEADRFQYPDTTQRLAADFGGWFLDALQMHVTSSQGRIAQADGNPFEVKAAPPPPAWKRLLDMKPDPHVPPGLLFALGMNAHIRNDLPQSAEKVGVTPAYKDDFFHVDAIIGDLAPLLTPAYVPPPFLLHRGMTLVVNTGIGFFREWAWDDYLELRHARMLGGEIAHRRVVDRIEASADSTAEMLLFTKVPGKLATMASGSVGLRVQPFPSPEAIPGLVE